MKSWILVHEESKQCYDFVEKEGETIPFPVAPPLIWIDVTEYPIKPQHGWLASELDGEWSFTDPNEPQPTEGE